MHQPLIPAGGRDLRTAAVISNLKHMMDHPGIGDNHNATVFHWCYKRMGEFIPQLIDEGKNPRIMLDYSGTLLHGLRSMGANDVIDALKPSPATAATAAASSGWARPGDTPSRPRRRCRISACTCAPGSTISPPSSARRRCAACAASRRRRWRCPTIPTSPTNSSRR